MEIKKVKIKNKHSKKRFSLKKSFLYLVVIFLALLWIFPFLVVVITSIREQGDIIMKGVFALPKKIQFDSFFDAWIIGNFKTFYKNSLLISFLKVPTGIIVASLAAYPLAKWKFKLREPLFIFFLLGLGIPIQITLLPVSIILKKIHLLDSLVGLFFPYIAFGLPLQILIFRGFFRTIPDSFIDAAYMDGASRFQIYRRIIMPIAKPAIAAVFIIDFLATWNEFLMALIFIHSEKWKTVPLGMMYFQGQFGSDYSVINAGVIISILPVVLVYIFLQKYFVSGMTGGIKG